jgi:hypothetical protein
MFSHCKSRLWEQFIISAKEKNMKKLVTAVMVVLFALGTAGLSMAATVKCTVDSVDGDKVTMTCEKEGLKAGDKVEVKSKGGKKGYEGC